jgi:ketosteroid isomerase-like protein
MFTQTTLEDSPSRLEQKKPMIKSILACLLFTGSAFAQTPMPVSLPSSSERNNLIVLERMWNQAQVSRDSTAIAGMIGDKFVNTEYDGEVSNRGKFLADFADPKFKPSIMNSENLEVATYGTTAIVTGDYHTKGLYAGKPYEHFGRFTDTWVFQDGKWLCVASHSSLVKK